MSARQILAVILLVLVCLFVAMNWQRARINLFGVASFEMPISLVVLGALVVGFLAAAMLRALSKKPAKH